MTKYATTAVADELTVGGKQLRGFSTLPPEEAFGLRQRLVDSAAECGCQAGAMAASLALSAYLVVTVALPLLNAAPLTFVWWRAAAVLFAGALAGKTFAVVRARRRFDATLREFQERTAARPGGTATPDAPREGGGT